MHAADLRVRKTTTNSFHGTNLQELLQERSVERLLVCGLQSDFCINATVRCALKLGYPVTLVADAHSTVDKGRRPASEISAHHNRTLASMAACGLPIDVKPTAVLLSP